MLWYVNIKIMILINGYIYKWQLKFIVIYKIYMLKICQTSIVYLSQNDIKIYGRIPLWKPSFRNCKKHTNRVPVFPRHFKKEQILAASINYIPVILTGIGKKIFKTRNLILCKSEHFSYLKYLNHNIYICCIYITFIYIFTVLQIHIFQLSGLCVQVLRIIINMNHMQELRNVSCVMISPMPSSSRTSCGSGWVVLLSGAGL